MDKSQYKFGQKGPPAQEIAEWIRNQIRGRRFAPGQRLVEVDIIRQTGGSRFKVREALQRLEAEGLVEIEEFRGASVREASMAEVRQLYRARGALEGICTGDFSRMATEEQRAQLRKLAQEMEACIEAGEPESFGRLNAQWHRLLMEGSGNFVLQETIKRLHTPIHHLIFESFYRPERLVAATQDHRAIIQAIESGNHQAAENAMRRHVENGLAYLTHLDSEMHFDVSFN